jgi:UrcA family protein
MRYSLILIMLAIGAQTPACARDEAAPRRTVSLKDLDLSRPHDRKVADTMINAAAVDVCGDYVQTGLLVPAPIRNCRKTTLASANGQVAAYVARSQVRVANR